MEVALHYTEAEVTEEDGQVWDLLVVLKFYAADPLAVSMVFQVDTDDEIPWAISREMLYEALEGPVGVGDVVMWPQDTYKTKLALRLASADGRTMSLSMELSEIREFLSQTEKLVPSGEEGPLVAEEIEDFLANLG